MFTLNKENCFPAFKNNKMELPTKKHVIVKSHPYIIKLTLTDSWEVSIFGKLNVVALSSYNYNTIKPLTQNPRYQIEKIFHIQTFNTVNKEHIQY